MKNQCDGCNARRPLNEHGQHRMGDGGYPDLMTCQRELYMYHMREGPRRRIAVDYRFAPKDTLYTKGSVVAEKNGRTLKRAQFGRYIHVNDGRPVKFGAA
jgi:hypothetical protein